MTAPTVRMVDLFSGCGGLTQGFVTASSPLGSFVPVGAVELDEFAAATYAANHGSHIYQGDIGAWIGTDLPAADIVVGGPPCQGFSSLGKRDPNDERNKLWTVYADVVAQLEPYYFLLENVPPFLKSRQFKQLELDTEKEQRLERYTIDHYTVLASDFGAFQKRRRALVIGRRDDMPPLPLETVKESPRTVKEAIAHSPHIVTDKDLPEKLTTEGFMNRDAVDIPGRFYTSNLHVTRHLTQLSMDRFRAIPPGGNRRDLPEHLLAPCWRNHKDGSHDVMGRLHWDRPSVTIRTEFWKPEKGRYLHPEAHRPITHMEAALLQGFPMDYKWCGTKISIGRQIGNAVPVELGRAVARAMLATLGTMKAPSGD